MTWPLLGDHAGSLINSRGNMTLAETGEQSVAKFIKDCIDAHGEPGPQSQASASREG